MIVIDTSVFIDGIFRYDNQRYEIAKEIFRLTQSLNIILPEIFKVELISQLVRRIEKKEALKIYNEIIEKIEIIPIEKLRELAFSVACDTGSRAIDSYFIATAKLTNSILITNDKIMDNNAKKAGIEAYYLIEEFKKVTKKIEELKQF